MDVPSHAKLWPSPMHDSPSSRYIHNYFRFARSENQHEVCVLPAPGEGPQGQNLITFSFPTLSCDADIRKGDRSMRWNVEFRPCHKKRPWPILHNIIHTQYIYTRWDCHMWGYYIPPCLSETSTGTYTTKLVLVLLILVPVLTLRNYYCIRHSHSSYLFYSVSFTWLDRLCTGAVKLLLLLTQQIPHETIYWGFKIFLRVTWERERESTQRKREALLKGTHR